MTGDIQPGAGMIEVESADGSIAVMTLLGEHDLATADELRSRLASLIKEQSGVVVDLSRSDFIDSSTLNALAFASHHSAEAGRPFVLQVGPKNIVWRVLDLSGVLNLIPHAESREDALAAVRDMRRS